MERHFEEADEIRTAALRGEVETVREVSVAFAARVAEATYPEPWADSVTRLEQVLGAATSVDDMRKGAGLVAEVGASCGSCHREHDVPVKRAWPLEPDPEHRMNTFAYATELLWLGLVVPSDEAWSRGAEAYHAALSCEDFDAVPVGPYHMGQCSSLRATGATVVGAKDDAARTRAFADVVQHCASCHGAPR
jgi:mono/diheme cytochrome c family protein